MTYDIVIIGNGILAYSTAFELTQQDPSLKIAVIGPTKRQGSASLAAGAMLNAFAEITNKSLAFKEGKKKFEMALSASKMWPSWINQINNFLDIKEHINTKLGTYVINNSLSGSLDCENYESILSALKSYGEEYEEIDRKKIPGLEALEGCRALRSLYIPQEGYIDSQILMQRLQKILENIPTVTLIDDEVLKINYDNGHVTSIQTVTNKNIFSDKILLAAGAFSQQLIDKIPEIKGLIPPIFAGVGISLTIKQNLDNPISHVIRTPNRSGACGLHVVPRDQDTLYIGASNNVYLQPSQKITAGISHFLLQCAIEQINQNFYKNEIVDWYVGNRPAPLDTFPLIGPTSLNGLWFLTGTYRDGFHQSPFLAKEMAKMILGKDSKIDKAFFPERSPISTRTIQESIDEYIDHYLAASYEHGAHPPRFLQEKGYAGAARNKVEKWYDKLGTTYGLAPDMVFMFDFTPNEDTLINHLKNYLINY